MRSGFTLKTHPNSLTPLLNKLFFFLPAETKAAAVINQTFSFLFLIGVFDTKRIRPS